MWSQAWQVWHAIGTVCVLGRLPTEDALTASIQNMEKADTFFSSFPSQPFLVHLLKVFPLVLSKLRPTFSMADFQLSSKVFYNALLMPVSRDVSPFLVPSSVEGNMSTLQRLVLRAMSSLCVREGQSDAASSAAREDSAADRKALLVRRPDVIEFDKTVELVITPIDEQDKNKNMAAIVPHLLEELLRYSLLASDPPALLRHTRAQGKSPAMTVNFTSFGMSSLALAVQVYRALAERERERERASSSGASKIESVVVNIHLF